MLKKTLQWAVFIALTLHLFSCIFMGQSFIPLIN